MAPNLYNPAKMRKHIPNAITLLNLFFGCCAILMLARQEYNWVYILFAASLVADFLDGMLARLLQAYSELGKQLDSLADMISFGALPGMILYHLLSSSNSLINMADPWWSYGAFLFTMMAAYRLGKFNLDERQSQDFLGIPTPAASLLTIGLLMIHQYNPMGLASLVDNELFLGIYILGISALMISELPMLGLKFKEWKWAGNEIRIIFVVLAVVCLPVFQWAAPAVIISIYILLSLGRWIITRNQAA